MTQVAVAPLTGEHFGLHIPFMEAIGLLSLTSDHQSAVTRLPWREDNTNSRGDVHGGALMSALDYTLSAAARAHIPESGMATIEMSTQFLNPARGDIDFTATCLQIIDEIAYCTAEARDAKQRLVATASASFKVVRKRDRNTRV